MKNVLLVIISAVIFPSCNKSEQEKSWELFINNHKENSEHFVVTAATIDTIEGNDKLNLIINATNFHFSNGTHVTTDIEIELKDVLKRKDILYEGLFTSAILLQDSTERLLKSKGMFKIDFFSEGQRVYPDSNIIFFWRDQYLNSGYNLYVFNPTTDTLWKKDTSPSFLLEDNIGSWLAGGSLDESLFSDSLTWINIDGLALGPTPTRQIIVQTNDIDFPISGYLVLNNYLTIVRLFHKSCSTCYRIEHVPNNADATILIVGYDVNAQQYYLSRTDTIVSSDLNIIPELQPISEEDLEIEIENLN